MLINDVTRFVNSARSSKYIFSIALAAVCILCSHSWADEAPHFNSSYLAAQVRTHRFICKSIDAEFTLRSDWTTETGPQNLKFESARFNGRDIELAPELHDIFDYLFDTEAIFGDCLEQSESIGVAVVAVTKLKEMPSVTLYFDLTDSGVKFRELVCKTENNAQGLSEGIYKYCTMKKW